MQKGQVSRPALCCLPGTALVRADELVLVELRQLGERQRLVVPGWTALPEGDQAGLHPFLHCFASRLHVVARVELVRRLDEYLADCAGHGHAVVGVDVDLAHAVLDAALDLFHRPYLLMMSCNSCGTLEEPCITRCVVGSFWWISSIRFITSTSPVGFFE